MGAVFTPPDWLPSAKDDCGAGAGAGAGAAARDALCAPELVALSWVPCVAQPAKAVAMVIARPMRQMFMVFIPLIGQRCIMAQIIFAQIFLQARQVPLAP